MIIVDIETTGLDPAKHAIVSIGAVDFYDHAKQFYEECNIRSCSQIDAKALEINGFTEEELRNGNKKSVGEIVENFIDWASTCRNFTLAGENVRGLDIPFLKSIADEKALPWPFGYRSLDLHAISYDHHILRGKTLPMKDNHSDLSLDKTLAFVGLPPEPKPHHALTGAKLEAEAFYRLWHGQGLFEEYKRYLIPEYL